MTHVGTSAFLQKPKFSSKRLVFIDKYQKKSAKLQVLQQFSQMWLVTQQQTERESPV